MTTVIIAIGFGLLTDAKTGWCVFFALLLFQSATGVL